MKVLNQFKFMGCLLAALLAFSLNAQNMEEPTGFSGDNFSLEGALDLFEKSASPEDFEKRLNKKQNSSSLFFLDF